MNAIDMTEVSLFIRLLASNMIHMKKNVYSLGINYVSSSRYFSQTKCNLHDKSELSPEESFVHLAFSTISLESHPKINVNTKSHKFCTKMLLSKA